MNTYSFDIILTEEQSTLTKIITTLRKLSTNIQMLHLEKETNSQQSYINLELQSNGSLSLLEKSLTRIEGVHNVCNTTK
jgi:acetolactate synthase regulatory subunit